MSLKIYKAISIRYVVVRRKVTADERTTGEDYEHGRAEIDPIQRRLETFVIWGSIGDPAPSREQVASLSDSLLRHHCALAMISTRQMDVPDTLAPRLRLIYDSPVRPMSATWYRVWVQSAPPSARCSTAAP